MTNLQLRPMESAIAGAQAFEAGTATVTIKGGGVGGSGAAVTDNGKYLMMFKRVGADWKITYDIFNSDQPPPTCSQEIGEEGELRNSPFPQTTLKRGTGHAEFGGSFVEGLLGNNC